MCCGHQLRYEYLIRCYLASICSGSHLSGIGCPRAQLFRPACQIRDHGDI